MSNISTRVIYTEVLMSDEGTPFGWLEVYPDGSAAVVRPKDVDFRKYDPPVSGEKSILAARSVSDDKFTVYAVFDSRSEKKNIKEAFEFLSRLMEVKLRGLTDENIDFCPSGIFSCNKDNCPFFEYCGKRDYSPRSVRGYEKIGYSSADALRKDYDIGSSEAQKAKQAFSKIFRKKK